MPIDQSCELIVDWAEFRIQQMQFWYSLEGGLRGKHTEHLKALENKICDLKQTLPDSTTQQETFNAISQILLPKWQKGCDKHTKGKSREMIQFLNEQFPKRDFLRAIGTLLQEISLFRHSLSQSADTAGFDMPIDIKITHPFDIDVGIRTIVAKDILWLHENITATVRFIDLAVDTPIKTKNEYNQLKKTAELSQRLFTQGFYTVKPAFMAMANELNHIILLNEKANAGYLAKKNYHPYYTELRRIRGEILYPKSRPVPPSTPSMSRRYSF
jgi:hypothetical protein